MGQLFRRWHRMIIRIVALSVMLSSIQPQLLFAQQADAEDFEAPTINLEVVNRGTLGEDQQFKVNAVDNIAVTSVSLFYRFSESEDFQEVTMESAGGDEFSTLIPTTDITASSIQYYIQAEDSTGNRALKGYNFDPLERSLDSNNLLAASSEEPPKKKSKTLYYVLGALAVLAIAGAAGGGGSSSDNGGGGGSCDASGCQVSLVIGTP